MKNKEIIFSHMSVLIWDVDLVGKDLLMTVMSRQWWCIIGKNIMRKMSEKRKNHKNFYDIFLVGFLKDRKM